MTLPVSASGETVKEEFQEYASSAGLTLRVDRERAVIPCVKILGQESKNGRTYTDECIAGAMRLYEQSPVFIDHQKRGEARSYHDRIGHLANVQKMKDGLYADFHFNPRHSLAEQLIWDAENAPAHVGFSHDVEGTTQRRDGKVWVESISSVNSVDLVAKPATTRGLFEDEEVPEDQREFCEHGLSAVSDARSILLGRDAAEVKKARLQEVLSLWQTELTGESVITGRSTMDWKEITLEGLREQRQDLVAALDKTEAVSGLEKKLQETETALKEANDKLAVIEQERVAREKTAAITEELKAAKLDPENKTHVSEAFRGMLEAAPDAAARKVLIEDRAALIKIAPAPARGAAPFAPVGDGVVPAKSKQELLSRL